MFYDENGNLRGVWKSHPEDTPIIEKVYFWLFLDYETGDEFIVKLEVKYNFLEENEPDIYYLMYQIAKRHYNDVDWLDEIDEKQADALGLEIYTK